MSDLITIPHLRNGRDLPRPCPDRGVLVRRGELDRLARELGVKVSRVGVAHDLRLEGRLHPALLQGRPVHGGEERVRHYLLGVVPPPAEALRRVLLQESGEEPPGQLGHLGGEAHRLHQDELEHGLVVVVVEGEAAGHHLVHDDADAPPVDGAPVVHVLQHLRGQVLRGAAEGLGGAAEVDVLLAQAEVGDLDVAVLVQEEVLQLEVAVDDAKLVQVVDGADDLGAVKP